MVSLTSTGGQIKQLARGRWPEIFSSLGVQAGCGEHRACPACGGKDRFRFDDQEGDGTWFCNGCDPRAGDGFALIQNVRHCEFGRALELVGEAIGMLPERSSAKPVRRQNGAKSPARALWENSIPDTGRVSQYLKSRGLSGSVPPSLRFVPSVFCMHRKSSEHRAFPVMLAKIVALDGRDLGAHATYLSKDGPGKAPVEEPRKTRKFSDDTISGGAIRLIEYQPGQPLVLTEGIETGLAVHLSTGMLVWACVSTSGLEAVQIPAEVTEIYIAVDLDRSGAGERSAAVLAQRLHLEGRKVHLVTPHSSLTDGAKSIDWLDVLNADGKDAVAKAFQSSSEWTPAGLNYTAVNEAVAPNVAELWPTLDEAAYQGLLGEFVKAVEPYSEADPVAILMHMLVGAGCNIGSNPHVLVEHSPHPARLNALCIGRTAGGRKGTSWSIPRYLFSKIDSEWASTRVKSGLSSGEGLVYAVRDAEGDDSGEPDKRLLIIESEFASTLKAMEREGNTLSCKIRDCWDHGTISPMTKRERLTATGAHVSIIGHITKDELLRSLTATERANGFANRFLPILVERSKFLPSGKGVPPSVLEPYFSRFSRTLERAQTRKELSRDAQAEELWCAVYPKIEEEVPGLTGAILARGAAQVLRISLIYALLDEREAQREDTAIRVPHLLAALGVWDFVKASVFNIFGDTVGDPIADRLLRAIKSGPQTDNDLYEILGKRGGDGKDRGLDLLMRQDRIHGIKIPTAGRPIREWHIGNATTCVICVKRG